MIEIVIDKDEAYPIGLGSGKMGKSFPPTP